MRLQIFSKEFKDISNISEALPEILPNFANKFQRKVREQTRLYVYLSLSKQWYFKYKIS